MRLNEHTYICGDRCILVPYRKEHVPKYHEWMKSPELLELTASEPLSLEEEYEMQQKWQVDEDKLTFIVLARPDDFPASSHPLLTWEQVQGCQMVGDVNLFKPEGSDDAECEIMIAEPEFRRKGIAVEALSLFITYAVHHLPLSPRHFIARIGTANTASISLFERLGFGKVRVVEVWSEAEMRWGWTESSGEEYDDSWADMHDPDAWPKTILEGRVGNTGETRAAVGAAGEGA
ncbi:acyl-CoA N-acyltransferase [Cutaneotrichosporon oleaginosum]|uniref:N-acetyltransferase 9-like protein n=1 Tax=Cutaneotrichosporon oleaginosum TaxID=879819 RepID=A0A0J0XLT7_9TREE|nr:acyl-CoA N-acyltransferase [Cutaneotrichosporon oleaginosum]KLT42060.1 acyl-CoA N-acyltransferase [Cutaneotrichosporon oleaginosum]TXT04701.1 hypothetical protein COLE_07520 [Cutaneotrichosporon oleaginosum]